MRRKIGWQLRAARKQRERKLETEEDKRPVFVDVGAGAGRV